MKSFDLVATNERVTVADMAHLPVEDSSADIVIFCLSLMGTNILDFVKEARRVLRLGLGFEIPFPTFFRGVLKIAEVSSRFHNLRRFCDAVRQLGFNQTEKVYFFIFIIRSVQKFFYKCVFIENEKRYRKSV